MFHTQQAADLLKIRSLLSHNNIHTSFCKPGEYDVSLKGHVISVRVDRLAVYTGVGKSTVWSRGMSRDSVTKERLAGYESRDTRRGYDWTTSRL